MSQRVLSLTALAIGAAVALTACSSDPSPSETTITTTTESTQDVTVHNDADVMFAVMMIAHHEQAIEMSDLVLGREGIDPGVADLAATIKEAQSPEIAQMQEWLTQWGQEDAEQDLSHAGHEDGMMTQEDMAALDQAPGEEASQLFLEQMIVHHEGAVDMAQQHLNDGKNAQSLDLAGRIIADQNTEIELMQQMITGMDIAASNGLAGLSVQEIINQLDEMPIADRPTTLLASVRPANLVLSTDGQEGSLPIPDDQFYLSFAPYVSGTHDCHFHSLTTCRGELQNVDMQVTITNAETGDVLVDEKKTSFDNGFVGVWLPRGITVDLTVSYDGKEASAEISTAGDEDATCVTTLKLA